MHWDVSVSLLVSVVFGDVVEVVASDDDGPLHLVGNDNSLQDLTPDGDVAGEGTFLIDIARFDGLLGGFESKPDVLEESDSRCSFLSQKLLAVEEDVLLLLESALVLRIDGDVTWMSAIIFYHYK